MGTETNRILSIIIPTKNRYEYLKDCLSSLAALDQDLIEIVVQDNTMKNDEIIDFIAKLDIKNICYYHDSRPVVSQTENSELAVANATGEYICYLGDDDSVDSCIIDVAKWMKSNNIDAVLCKPAVYYWPDVVFRKHKFSSLCIPGKKIKVHKVLPEDEREKCIKNGGTSIGILPRIYHGIVSREAVLAVKTRCGCVFPGASPDMASAIALSYVVNNLYFLDVPFILSGVGYKSAGGLGVRGKHKAKLSEVSQIPADIEDRWIKEVPQFWFGCTIWAHSCLEALLAMGDQESVKRFNFAALYGRLLIMAPDCSQYVFPLLKNQKMLTIKVFINAGLMFCWRSGIFLKNILKTRLKFHRENKYYNIASLLEAKEILNNYNTAIKVRDFLESYNM